VLLGVTRRSILEIARKEGRRVLEEPIRPEALFEASEAFCTGTSGGVVPIGSVDDRQIGRGDPPGSVTRALGSRLQRITRGEDPEFDHWLAYPDEPASGARREPRRRESASARRKA
jgi:branched-chain amino acid aminotransferase